MVSPYPEGASRISNNGYKYIKHQGRWTLAHHLIAGEARGHPINTQEERVIFIDGDRTNLRPENLRVVPLQNGRFQKIAKLKRQMWVLEEELASLERRPPRSWLVSTMDNSHEEVNKSE